MPCHCGCCHLLSSGCPQDPYGAHLHNASAGLEWPCQQALGGGTNKYSSGAASGHSKKGHPKSGFLVSFILGILWLQVTANYPYFSTPHPGRNQRQVRLQLGDEFCLLRSDLLLQFTRSLVLED